MQGYEYRRVVVKTQMQKLSGKAERRFNSGHPLHCHCSNYNASVGDDNAIATHDNAIVT